MQLEKSLSLTDEIYLNGDINVAGANARLKLHLEISKSKKGHNFVRKIGGLPPLLVWVPLLIVNNYSEIQVNIFSNNRDIRKCQFLHDAAADDARAMTIPRSFLRKQPS